MQTSDAKQNFRSDDPGWILLAELSFIDFLSGQDQRDERVVRSMIKTLQELGMLPESMDYITRTWAGFSKEACVRTKQVRPEAPGRIRIFCQKKMMDDEYAAKSSRPPEQDQQQKQIFPDSGVSRSGGWGYFIIERSEDLPPDSSAISQIYIDLYLYKEGE